MRASSRVEAAGREPQPLDGTALAQMLLDDFIEVFGADKPIPDLFGIDDDRRAMLALLQTAGFVDAKNSGELGRLELVFKQFVEFALAVRAARGASGPGLALIGADKDVAVKWWQWCSSDTGLL